MKTPYLGVENILAPVTSLETLTSQVTNNVPIKSKQRERSIGITEGSTIEETLRQRMEAMMHSTNDEGEEDAFFVADIGEVVRQFYRWRRLLPRVEPFYAIKCNPDPVVLDTLAGLGAGFDCASKEEINLVLQTGVDPSRIIYANPCKQGSMIRFASNVNVKMMTFDNEEELHKIKKFFPKAELVLRILVDDSYSVCRFGTKFGAPMNVVKRLLTVAKELDLNVIGVSFHVGSGCLNAIAFHNAVERARSVFDIGESVGFKFTLLDLGGGYPGNDNSSKITFEEIASVLGPAVDKFFPEDSVRVIAEPGRYFVSSAFTLAAHITARRSVPRDSESTSEDNGPAYMYYINDGVYGSFNCILYDHAVVKPRVLTKNGAFFYESNYHLDSEPLCPCSIWGPTCDSMDCITKDGKLPILDVGDWLYFSNMGAYTCAAASTFNGFNRSNIIYINTLKSQGCEVQ